MVLHPLLELLRRVRAVELEQPGVAGLALLAGQVAVQEDRPDHDGQGADQVIEVPAGQPLAQLLPEVHQRVGFDDLAIFRLHVRQLLARGAGEGLVL